MRHGYPNGHSQIAKIQQQIERLKRGKKAL
jgi:hypothetical protein